MGTIITFLLLWGWLNYRDGQRRSGLRWYEIKGVTKFLLLGEMPERPKCRACGKDLPKDTLFHVELSAGVFVHEECSEQILLEAGLSYPSWFEQPLPPEGSEVPKLEAPGSDDDWFDGTCLGCGESIAEDEVCLTCMKKATQDTPRVDPPEPNKACEVSGVGKYRCVLCKEDHGTDSAPHHAGGIGGAGGTGDVMVTVKTQAGLALENPRMNAVISPPGYVPEVRHCEPCKSDHRRHEKCPVDGIGGLPHNCYYCGRYIVTKGLCDRCIMWGTPGGFLPCGRCTYYHDASEPHPEVFRKAIEGGNAHEFIERRLREGYRKEDRWSWRGY